MSTFRCFRMYIIVSFPFYFFVFLETAFISLLGACRSQVVFKFPVVELSCCCCYTNGNKRKKKERNFVSSCSSVGALIGDTLN